LKKAGYRITEAPDSADAVIINTCSFIEDAKKESIDVILDVIELKKTRKIKWVLVAGCLAQKYGKALLKELSEVDGFIGVGDFPRLPEFLTDVIGGRRIYAVSPKPVFLYDNKTPRQIMTPRHFAYIKISEGCSHKCSFCAIPKIRGQHRSRRISSVMDEAQHLVNKGVKEINLIGQDITFYGLDLYRRPALTELLKGLASIKGAHWIRLLYMHPSHFSDDLISVIAGEKQICKYIDLPIQHVSEKVLRAMRRPASKSSIYELIAKLRKRIPGVVIRTSVIVGFPGESGKEFGELADFVKEIEFERLGAFIYSREEETPAAKFKKQVPDDEKLARWNEIMGIQKTISSENNKELVGREFEILIDEKDATGRNLYLGRTYMDAPEVDGSVYITGRAIKVGEFTTAKITDTLEYDLVGEKKEG